MAENEHIESGTRRTNQMLLRNWIELGIVIAMFIAGLVTKHITRKKCKKIEGFIKVNDQRPGHGWKMR